MTAPSWPAAGSSPDEVYAAVTAYAESKGLELYPHQDEAVIELLAGSNVVLATPTGSGKSLVALAAHAAALASDRVSFYTAPIKALVSEKFFDLCQVFGAEDVGMLTGDAAVNPDAPIICCTAEILANLTLREGRAADVGLVVMDEFHYYGEPDRGWAWQVPLLELPDTQFLLMSATLGDTTELREDLTARTGRESVLVDQAERPVPLSFTWSLDPVAEKLEELVTTGQAPVYVVHFTQKDAVEHATSLVNAGWVSAAVSKERKAELDRDRDRADAKRDEIESRYQEAKTALSRLSAPQQKTLTKSDTTVDFTVEASGRGAAAIQFAMAQLGKPYIYGGVGPDGYDCSGLVMKSFEAAGASLPRVVGPQYQASQPVPISQVQPGDIVFFPDMSHDGIYLGDGKVIHAPRPGKTVEITTLSIGFTMAGRVG